MMTSKHRKRLATYFLIGLTLIQCVRCIPELVRIGGLFGENDEDPSVENTFKYALYRLNHDRTILEKTKVIYDIQRVPPHDGFLASKKVCFQVGLNSIALFGPRSYMVASYVNSMCNALKIPHIEVRMDHFLSDVPTFSINLHPDMHQLSKAYLDVITYFQWKQVLVIFGDKEGLLRLQRVIKAPLGHDAHISIRQVDDRNMRQVLREAKDNKWKNFIIDLSVEKSSMFLRMALQEGMVDPYHHYILTTLDIETIDMEDFKHNYVNLTGFRIVDPDNSFTNKIMRDMEIYEIQTDLQLLNKSGSMSYEAALMFDAVYLFAKGLEDMAKQSTIPLTNLTCDSNTKWITGAMLYTYLNTVEMRGLSGNIKLTNGRRMDFSLDILQLKEIGLRKVGVWNLNSGANFSIPQAEPTPPFGNKAVVVTTVLEPLKVTTLLEKPYIMVKDENAEGNSRYEGFCIDLLHEIAQIVGFEYTIELVPDGKYGAPNDNQEWDGMIRQLIDRKADLAVAGLSISYIREQVIDFTKPFLNLGISILFKVPKREKPGLFSFLNPLAIEIWLYVIAAYLVVSFTIFILARFSPYEWYNPHPCNQDTDTVMNSFTLSNSFWFTVGTLMQQGSDINPRAVSTRIVGGIWWFFTLIVISSYTANLAAFLTVERMVSPIESAEDLAKQTEISYGTLDGGSTKTFFKESKIETYQRMWAFMESREPSVFTKNYEEGIQRVLEGNYAYLMESTMIDYITQRNCELMQVGGLLDTKGYGIGTPVNSPYRDKLSLAILELQEGGKIHVLYNKWWKATGTCNRDENKKESKANALGVENVGGIFVVLLAGLALAVIVALIEFTWSSKRNASEDRVSKQSVCAEMADELRFAVRCHGSQKPRFKRHCSKCKSTRAHNPTAHSETHVESPNGVIQLREVRKSPRATGTTRDFEYDYKPDYKQEFSGDYLHVDYSDPES